LASKRLKKAKSAVESEVVEQLGGVPQDQALLLKAMILSARGKPRRYVVTSAQNDTPVHQNGLRSLLTYCKESGAQLLVVPYRYRNPTSVWSTKSKQADRWAPVLEPYLIDKRVFMNKNLILIADIMTQPTAMQPLEGFETIVGPQSGIIGHPKLELMTVPTPQNKLPKILTTTGAITKKNYIPSKAGKKGEHHHTFGACLVEIADEERFHIRQLNMRSDGSFCDLLSEYDGLAVRKYERVAGLVMGDVHVNVVDWPVVNATFVGSESLVGALKPEYLVWHDVHDGTAKNHHDRARAFHALAKFRARQDNVMEEVQRTVAFIEQFTPPDTKNIIVPSNHNDFLRKWVEDTDPRADPENGVFWAETYLALARSPRTRWTGSGVTLEDAFAYWGRRWLKKARGRTTFLRRGESFLIKGIEVGFHGDRGLNGARGNRRAFGKIGVKNVIGHAHSSGISDGCYQVGTKSMLDLTYASGSPSGWLHTDCIIYPNGKRSLVSFIDGDWRLT